MADTVRMRAGEFLGDCRTRRRVGALELADLRPTVPERDVATHAHDDAHVLLLLQGTYLSGARGMPEACTTPALVLNPPGTVHRDRFRGADGRFFTVSLAATAWRALCGEHRLPDGACRLGDGAQLAVWRIWLELRRWDAASPLVVDGEWHTLLGDAANAPHWREDRAPRWLARARERLDDAPADVPTLGALAREAGIHPVYFARAFRRRYGASPGEYLRRRRALAAAALLQAGRLSPAEVAACCGFVDQSHLTRALRSALRITPAALRALAHR